MGKSIHATAGTLWLSVEVIHTDWELFTESVDMSPVFTHNRELAGAW
jgi:hypothetical protein